MAQYSGNSIVDYLSSNKQASDFGSRSTLAKKYNIANYSGTAEQNTSLLNSLRNSANPSATGTNPVLATPAAQSFVQNQSRLPTQQNSSPAYGAGGVPNFKTSTPTPTASSSDGFPPYVGPLVSDKPFGSINDRDYNWGGGFINPPVSNTNTVTGAQGAQGSQGSGVANTVINGGSAAPTSGYTSPDRQAYIDAYKKYIEAQTNNEDVRNAKTAYNDFITEQSKAIAGQEGRGLGIPLSIVRGTQEKLKRQTDPEAQRLQNAIGIAQTGQTNLVGARKSGVDLEKNLLDFGASDRTAKLAEEKALRDANPAFELSPEQTRYVWDSKTGQYKKVAEGLPKSYKETSDTTNTTPSTNEVNQHIRKEMATPEFKKMNNEQKKDFILMNGGNPVDYNLY